MPNPIKVSASILCADFTNLGAEIRKCEDAGVDGIHFDVMDGHFVPNISIGLPILEAIRPLTKLPIETHLMITNPTQYLEPFAKAGADVISIHVECYGSPAIKREAGDFAPWTVNKIDAARMRQDIKKIQSFGKKAVAVVNPATPFCFEEILNDIDGVLIMSVNPGYARQKFIPDVLPKIAELRKKFNKDIALDGGVNAETSPAAVKAGINILATASYFFGAPSPKDAVQFLKSLKP
jgi:ribulose-phosphate 3-epimerase